MIREMRMVMARRTRLGAMRVAVMAWASLLAARVGQRQQERLGRQDGGDAHSPKSQDRA